MTSGKIVIIMICLMTITGCHNKPPAVIETDQHLEARLAIAESIKAMEEEMASLKETLKDHERSLEAVMAENKRLMDALELKGVDDAGNSLEAAEAAVILKTVFQAEAFLRAYVTGDINGLLAFESEVLSFDKDQIIIAEDGSSYHYCLIEDAKGYYLGSYGYDQGHMYYQYVVYKDQGVDVTGRFFMNLKFTEDHGMWSLSGLEFDI